MAKKIELVPCPACRNKLSEQAVACPQCGQSLEEGWAKDLLKKRQTWETIKGMITLTFLGLIVYGCVQLKTGKNDQLTTRNNDACDVEAASFAAKMNSTTGHRWAGDMVAIVGNNNASITYGCSSPKSPSFLAIYHKEGVSESDFFGVVGWAGGAFTHQPTVSVIESARQCVRAARLEPHGFSCRPFGGRMMECGGATKGAPLKVTFESRC